MADTFEINLLHKEFAAAVSRYIGGSIRDMERTIGYMTSRIHNRVIAYSPVETGNLQNSWRANMVDKVTGKISTHVPYAPVLEYGGYRGVGPRTVQLGMQTLGYGLIAGGGIYSKQAPHGMLRRALADEGKEMVSQMRDSLRRNWGR